MGVLRILKKIRLEFINRIIQPIVMNPAILKTPILISKKLASGTQRIKLRPCGFNIKIGDSRYLFIVHDLGKRTYKGAKQVRRIWFSLLRFKCEELINLWWVYR